MKLVLILGLMLVGLLEVADFSQPRLKSIIGEGEVKGKQHASSEFSASTLPLTSPAIVLTPSAHPFTEVSVVPSPSPSLSSPSFFAVSPPPSLSSLPLSSPPSLSASPPPVEIILLEKSTKLQDEWLKIDLPPQSRLQGQSGNWFLELELELVSAETMLGFDSPGLLIYIGQQLVYQRTAFESGPAIISFSLANFGNFSQGLSIWSGNEGDDLGDTSLIIKKIKLIFQANPYLVETEAIRDLDLTVDNDDYLTLEWASPKNNDSRLAKPMAYEIRYSTHLISEQNWSQAQSAEVVLPQNFSPLAMGAKEMVLVKIPALNSGYLVVRSIDSSGKLSPLGKNTSFER